MSPRSILLLLLATALVTTLTGGLVGWGLSSASQASATRPAAGATGAPGTSGTAGATGPKGDAGAMGPTGATGDMGATGPTGATGPRGLQGVQGVPGPAGAPGPAGSNATIPTYSYLSAAGGIQALPFPSGGPFMPSTVPTRPALVGFSMSLTGGGFGQTTCGLYSLETGDLIASAAPVSVSPTPALVALTQVVTLSSPTTLQLECTNPAFDNESYTNLSMYALSFA
ncbi:MAG TPA: hypothetical protein VFQ74_10795 [Pseudolysinimonas sp.]|nr:hypothetical protein [Pseudolysinimonas sp.]